MTESEEKALRKNLKAIRDLLDTDVTDCAIESVQNKATMLTQIIGLSAECKAEARRLTELKKLAVLTDIIDKGYAPSLITKMLDAEAATENALYVYADRLNAGITHAIDMLRTSISLYKSELENSLKG